MPATDAIHPGVRVRRCGDAIVLGRVGVRWPGATLTNTAVRQSPGTPPPVLAVLMDESGGQSARALGSPIGQRARSRLADGLRRRHVETFLGGAFYSIDILPPAWRAVSLFNPIVYLVSGFRWSFYSTSDVGVGVSLAATLAFFVLCLAVVVWVFRTGYRLKS